MFRCHYLFFRQIEQAAKPYMGRTILPGPDDVFQDRPGLTGGKTRPAFSDAGGDRQRKRVEVDEAVFTADGRR